jgi:hypothetical protein
MVPDLQKLFSSLNIKERKMATQKKQAEFIKWLAPLLDVLRELRGSGRPKEVSQLIAVAQNVPNDVLVEMFKQVELGMNKKTVYEVDLPFFEPLMERAKQ